MPITTLQFKLPPFYDLSVTCHAHGWRYLAPFNWDEGRGAISFALLVNDRAVDLFACQRRACLSAQVRSGSKLRESEKLYVRHCINRALDLDTDTTALLVLANSIDKRLARLVKNGAGRMLRSPTAWEDAAKTLFTTNCSWGLTKKMAHSACSAGLAPASPAGRFPFPAPATIAALTEAHLKKRLPVGYRAGYLRRLAAAFSPKGPLHGVDLTRLGRLPAQTLLASLAGFGPYATNHMMLLSGYYREIPVDTVVTSYLKQMHRTRDVRKLIDKKYKAWGDYRWWGLTLEKMHQRVYG
jgi:N-glycosylase/DNA lyase